ncbi:histone-lysine N-methyltransferase SETD1A-like [Trichogramma pretiosum]|uniref:histone-lysine N-methyltransferase SETD1A-like n=1 Tax=Trichogramma pretiosum TaxID=7493 RepID=UPI0006C97B13|nr:histone-lysine N-methyltransferase SETD1A-like [Trichogramma pretiosum]
MKYICAIKIKRFSINRTHKMVPAPLNLRDLNSNDEGTPDQNETEQDQNEVLDEEPQDGPLPNPDAPVYKGGARRRNAIALPSMALQAPQYDYTSAEESTDEARRFRRTSSEESTDEARRFRRARRRAQDLEEEERDRLRIFALGSARNLALNAEVPEEATSADGDNEYEDSSDNSRDKKRRKKVNQRSCIRTFDALHMAFNRERQEFEVSRQEEAAANFPPPISPPRYISSSRDSGHSSDYAQSQVSNSDELQGAWGLPPPPPSTSSQSSTRRRSRDEDESSGPSLSQIGVSGFERETEDNVSDQVPQHRRKKPRKGGKPKPKSSSEHNSESLTSSSSLSPPTPLDRSPENKFPSPDYKFPSPEKKFPTPEKKSPTPEKKFPTPEKKFPTPENESPTPEKKFSTPEKIIPSPEKEFPTPEKKFSTPEKIIPSPEREFSTPEKKIPSPGREL